jgi:hypothetical protein
MKPIRTKRLRKEEIPLIKAAVQERERQEAEFSEIAINEAKQALNTAMLNFNPIDQRLRRDRDQKRYLLAGEQ